ARLSLFWTGALAILVFLMRRRLRRSWRNLASILGGPTVHELFAKICTVAVAQREAGEKLAHLQSKLDQVVNMLSFVEGEQAKTRQAVESVQRLLLSREDLQQLGGPSVPNWQQQQQQQQQPAPAASDDAHE
ncbi:hypothetical protein BOX15_Mlig002458g1, partial [Macrostomum lignano]